MSVIVVNPYLAKREPLPSSALLYLNAEGSDGSTTILDSSSSARTITAQGDARISTALPAPSGNSSILLDGNGDYFTMNTIGIAGNFTAEAWAYRAGNNAANTYGIVFCGYGFSGAAFNTQFAVTTSGAISCAIAGAVIFVSAENLVLNSQWNHIAWTRDGTTVRGFVNGILVATGTSSSAAHFRGFGAFIDGNSTLRGNEFNGNLDEVLIFNTCRYTSDFTPSGLPYG